MQTSSPTRGRWSVKRHWITWTSALLGISVLFIAATGLPFSVFWHAPSIPEANLIDVKEPRPFFSSVPDNLGEFSGSVNGAGKVFVQMETTSKSPFSLLLRVSTSQQTEKYPGTNEAVSVDYDFKNVHESGTYNYGPIAVKILKLWKPPYPWYETPWGPYATDYYQVDIDASDKTWPANPASWEESRTD